MPHSDADIRELIRGWKAALDEHEEADARRFDEIQSALRDFGGQQATMHAENRDDISRILAVLEGDPLDAKKPGVVMRLHTAEKSVETMQAEAVSRSKTAKKLSMMALVGVAGLAGKAGWDWFIFRLGGHP